MSTFKVTVERIGKVYPHPNADKLQLAQVKGMTFQFCVMKDEYKVDDTVAYFPIDSVLPQPLVEFLDIGKFLAGKDKNRIKTVKLRGEISQGFVVRTNFISDYILRVDPLRWHNLMNVALNQTHSTVDLFTGMDLTETLGVTKYDPPEVPCHAGNLVHHPDGVVSYDIEGCDRYPDVLEKLLDQPVLIFEKMEGSNHYCSITADNKIIVGQRNYAINPIEGKTHDWWMLAEKFGYIDALKTLKTELGANQITIRSEACGPTIQDNIYGFKEKSLHTFDILVDGKYMDAGTFTLWCLKLNLTTAPILSSNIILRHWLDGKTIAQASHGLSYHQNIQGVIREGIVIKPMVEQEYFGLPENRLLLKQRDPIYLAKQKE